jgi:competence protein ComEC
MTQRNKKSVLILLGSLFLANVLAWIAVFSCQGNNFLRVSFLDVGQGDSTFIETPYQNQILVDGGPGSAVLEKLGREMPFWDRTLDLVVLTHPEKDHMAGLIEVLKKYKVKNILWTGIVRDTAEYREWTDAVEKESANVVLAKAGEKISFGDAEFDVLFPLENMQGQELKDSNNSSVVIKLVYGENSFLLTGDLVDKGEEEIMQSGENVDSDVLKVAHHGSKTSSEESFISAVSPETAVISAGKNNSYGLPAAEILDELSNYGINILRTDLSGDITILSDGKNLIYK